MRVILADGSVMDLSKTNMNFSGGHTSKHVEQDVFQDRAGKLWRIKTSNIIEEYIGFSAYKALEIDTPEFNIGVVHREDKEDIAGSLIFLQEYLYLPDTSLYSINICSEDEMSLIGIVRIVPLLVGIAIIGDTDGVGRGQEACDNVLLHLRKGAPPNTIELIRLIKIYCGEAFKVRDPQSTRGWLTKSSNELMSPLYKKFISKVMENAPNTFIEQICTYLNSANKNIDVFKKAIETALAHFDELIQLSDTKKFASINVSRIHGNSSKRFTHLPELLTNNIKVLLDFFRSKHAAMATITVESSSSSSSATSAASSFAACSAAVPLTPLLSAAPSNTAPHATLFTSLIPSENSSLPALSADAVLSTTSNVSSSGTTTSTKAFGN